MLSRYHWIFFALLFPGISRMRAEDWPWTMLTPANESRDAGMCRFDEIDVRHTLRVLDHSDKFIHSHFVFSKIPITKLLAAPTPFGDLHFDSINPMEFTPGEKSILKEWLKRGGFLIAFEDTYPYEQDVFHKKHDLPVFDFFTRELPAEDPDFTVKKAGPDHPFFRQPFPTKPAAPIQVEMQENPNFRGYTMLLYKGRTVVFFMGRYSYMDNGRWVPMRRPFPEAHDLALESYALMINVYFYAITH
ncbi:MAG: hypothetical protein WCD79_00540 [Chthoniobacteraceae bacterium]